MLIECPCTSGAAYLPSDQVGSELCECVAVCGTKTSRLVSSVRGFSPDKPQHKHCQIPWL